MSNALIPYTDGGATLILGSSEHIALNSVAAAGGGSYYPDGSHGHMLVGGNYYWNASCGNGQVQTVGTLDDIASISSTFVGVSFPSGVSYIGVDNFFLSNDGSWLALTHVEFWGNTPATQYWAALYLLRSTNQGASWTVIGPAINPGFAKPVPNSGIVGAYDVGGGSPVHVGKWLYCFFIENPTSDQTFNYVSVARVDFATLCTSAASGSVAAFSKYASGAWATNALTGTADQLSGMQTIWFDVGLDSQTGMFVMLLTGAGNGIGDGDSVNKNRTIYMTTSKDGIHWTALDLLYTVDSSSSIGYPFPIFRDYTSERSGCGELLVYTGQSNTNFFSATHNLIYRNAFTLHRGCPRTNRNRSRGGPACAVAR